MRILVWFRPMMPFFSQTILKFEWWTFLKKQLSRAYCALPLTFFLILTFVSKFAYGFDSLPEYTSHSGQTPQINQDFKFVDSEYSSDFLSFQKPAPWTVDFWTHKLYLDSTIGSISSKEFLVDHRLKLTSLISKNTEFRFFWIESASFDERLAKQVFEFNFALNPNLSLSFYGSPAYNKSENEIGLATEYKNNTSTLRAYVLAPDFDLNKRSRLQRKWTTSPLVSGFVGRRIENSDSFLEVSYRNERPSNLLLNLEQYSYRLHSHTAQIQYQNSLAPDLRSSIRILADQKNENVKPLSSSVPEDNLERKRILLQSDLSFSLHNLTLKPGLGFFYREYKSMAKHFSSKDILPLVWLYLPHKEREAFTEQFRIGYDLNLNWSKNPDEMLSSSLKSFEDEHRLNVIYAMNFKQKSELLFLLSFDLDRFGSGETWEGGSAQLKIPF